MTTLLALISGSTGGIGRVVTERLWHEGYSLIALGHTTSKVHTLNDWFLEHPREGQHAFVLCLDLRHTTDLWRIHSLLQTAPLRDDGPLSLLVTCHGAAPAVLHALYPQALQAMDALYAIDVHGTAALCQLAGQYMVNHGHGGSMVLVSSLHAQMTYPRRMPYCVAKAAVCGLARGLAVEWGQYNIRVNSILPWQVRGERSQAFMDAARMEGHDLEEAYKQRSPMRRLIEPEEIAETVVWLSKTPSVSGAEVVLDGATSQSMWYQGFMANG